MCWTTRCLCDRWYKYIRSSPSVYIEREKRGREFESHQRKIETAPKKWMFKKEYLLIYTSHNFWHTRIKFSYFELLFIIIIYYVAFSLRLIKTFTFFFFCSNFFFFFYFSIISFCEKHYMNITMQKKGSELNWKRTEKRRE